MKTSKLFPLKIGALIVLLAAGGGANGQEVKNLTLKEAVQLTLANSKVLKADYSKLEQNSAAVKEAKMKQLPDLKVSGTYMRLVQPTIDLKFAQGSGQSGEGGNETGGALANLKVNQVLFGSFTASVPLFSGFRIKGGIESAKFLQRAAQLDGAFDREAEIGNTVAAFYNVYKAQAAVKLVEENLKTATQRVIDFANLEKNGVIARNDFLKAQLQESNIELALLDAQNNAKVAGYNFCIMLGLPTATRLELDTSTLNDRPPVENPEEIESMALLNRSDYQALQQREEAAKTGVDIMKGEKYPSLALTGGYIAADIPKTITVTNAVNVGLGLSYNIASLYKTDSKIRQVKAQQQQLHLAGEQLTDGIRVAVFKAYQEYTEALKKLDVYAKAVEQAKENYRITKNKYDNSLALTTDLLDADVARLQSQINYEYARADIRVAYNKLYETAGILGKKLDL